jgi:hypothetical protein
MLNEECIRLLPAAAGAVDDFVHAVEAKAEIVEQSAHVVREARSSISRVKIGSSGGCARNCNSLLLTD